jgi:hypothetical protein
VADEVITGSDVTVTMDDALLLPGNHMPTAGPTIPAGKRLADLEGSARDVVPGDSAQCLVIRSGDSVTNVWK